MKIYTRTGDGGETSFLDGGRVSKSALRVDAYGDVDELNTSLGVARSEIANREILSVLDEIQGDLFSVGALLADPQEQLKSDKSRLDETNIKRLEEHIDRFELQLPPLKRFVLPGGSPARACPWYWRHAAAKRWPISPDGSMPKRPKTREPLGAGR